MPLADRPEGLRLLATVIKGDIIITPKLDRPFRSAADALVTLEHLKDCGVGLHMLDLGGDVCGNGISKWCSRSCPPSPRMSASAPGSASAT
jgi:putative DNA-invertase from lambdoid prophage Rac